ncbi:trigger factor [Litorivicinus sp.]|jgi:trigger factor|nr:trigger factor [Litorivicinus sp.]HBZ91508.1 trigger factor [Gammaproteobacteria bacterium]
MQVVLESPSALERQFTITIPTGDVETEFEAKLAETAKRVRIDGFRPGKVPAKVVRQRYGQAIRQEIVSDLMEKSLGEALSEHDVKPIGQPKIDDVKFEEGSDFSFKATFEVFPELDPILVDGDEIEQTTCKVGAADIKEMIATLREQRKSWKESARAASKEGDRVTINFEGFVDGEAFDGGKGEDHALVLGSGAMIPGFEDGIVGMKKGDSRDIEVTFPEDYQAEELKGKAATFKIEVTKLERGELPTVDEAFIQSFGVESGDEKDFKAELKEQMQRELSLTLKNMNKTKVFDVLLEKNADTPVPESAIKSEIHTLKHQAVERFGGGQQFDPHQLPDELFAEQAERRVRLGILLGATVKKLGLAADPDRVRALIDEMAAAYDDAEQVVNFYYSNDENLKQVEALAVEEQVAEKLLESAKAKTIDMSYADVMKSRQS